MKTTGVAMAAYNGENYIGQQLESIMSQTHRPDFIVVSDGMSDDATAEISKSVLEKSGIDFQVLTSDIRLSVNENFQRALDACDTDYIFISDQDDVWNSCKIERMLELAENTQAGLVFSNAELVNSSLISLGSTMWDTMGYSQSETVKIFEGEDADFLNLLLKDNIATGMCMCISRELKETALPLSQYGLHDVWLTLISCLNFRTVALNESLVQYRQHGSNAVGGSGGLRTSLKNRGLFVKRLNDREKLINELIQRIDVNNFDADITAMLEDYDSFLKHRIAYISGKQGFPVKELMNGRYGAFSRKPMMITLKDVYGRMFL